MPRSGAAAPSLIPPHNLDLERAILGALIAQRDPGQVLAHAAALRATDFYLDRHRLVFAAVHRLATAGLVVDFTTLAQALQDAGELDAIGLPDLATIAAAGPLAPIDSYLTILVDLSRKRELIRLALQTAAEAQNGAASGPLLEALLATMQALAARGPGGIEPAVLAWLNDVRAERVDWLWPGRLARGKLTVVMGDPGLGKSFLTLDIAARLSTQREWPDGRRGFLANVLLLSAEDGLGDTIRPRLDSLGADPARVCALQAIRHDGRERPFSLADDLARLRELVSRHAFELLVIDPLSAYMGQSDTYKDSDVRALLAELAHTIEATHVSVLAVMHMGKASGDQRRAIHRMIGSVAFSAAPRIVLAVGKDREQEERRLLMPVKSNLSASPATLAYRITEDRFGTATIAWEPEAVADVDVDTILSAGPTDRMSQREAEHFLVQILREGPVAASEVEQAARVEGIAERTLNRARKALGVTATRTSTGRAGRGSWVLSLPPPAEPEDPRSPPSWVTEIEPPTSPGQFEPGSK